MKGFLYNNNALTLKELSFFFQKDQELATWANNAKNGDVFTRENFPSLFCIEVSRAEYYRHYHLQRWFNYHESFL